jgi:hypothetical protein
MNIKLLVDAIVQQTTVLIAQLSTNAGVRAPLAQLADQVFLSLSRELEAQGVGRKVAADMFGLALRGYQKKTRRAAGSASIQGKTLFEAVLEWVEGEDGVTRKALLEHFRRDNEREVIGVVNELVHCGLLYSSGAGAASLYGVTSDAERQRLTRTSDTVALENMALGAVYRCPGIKRSELVAKLNVTEEALDAALAALASDERISLQGDGLFARTFQIPVGAEHGWEAAVFDHFQAVATAIGAKVQLRGSNMPAANVVGGTTLRFEVSRTHPKLHQVLSLLLQVRTLTDEVWTEVTEHNAKQPLADDERLNVTFYFGQSTDDPTFIPPDQPS